MKRKSKAGFTIVEATVAAAILALVISGFFVSFLQAMRAERAADRHYDAAVLAKNRVEYAKVYAFGSLETLIEDYVRINKYGEADSSGSYWRTTKVVPSQVNPRCKEITVQVWYEKFPGEISGAPVEVATMIGP